jgi:hypothetical protein
MITSNQIISIHEKWFKSLHRDYNNALFDIYVNPSSSDYSEIYKANKRSGNPRIRFLADNNTKMVYVWDAFLAIHPDVAKKLGITSNLYGCSDPNIITGEATVSGGKSNILTVCPTNPKIIKDVSKINWSWLDSYLVGIRSAIKEYEYR